jgi:serine/threonine protein kinase
MNYFESEMMTAGRSEYQLTPIRDSLGRKENEEDTSAVAPKEHDLLSFMSLIVIYFRSMTTDYSLLGILLDGDNYDLPDPAVGQFFSVSITEGESIFGQRRVNIALDNVEPPEFVALKTPIMTRDTESPRNQSMLSSMATELQILRHEYIRDCENIVDLLGVCWQRLDTSELIVPAFVLECAELGDLDQFVKDKRVCSHSETMQFCIGIAAGVSALHEIGVVHCDLKPRNILVFKHESRSFIPKIADFGSSFLLSSAEWSAPKGISPRGTRFFQAPEWQSAQGRPKRLMMNQLMTTDIWSLGFILWGLMKGWAVFEAFKELGMDTFGDLKRSGTLVEIALGTLRAGSSGEVGSHSEALATTEDEDDAVQQIQMEEQYLIYKTLNHKPSERWKCKEVLQSLRDILSMDLRRELLTTDSSIRTKHNELEEDVMLQPPLGLPSEEDEERIWQFAQSRHFIESIRGGLKGNIVFNGSRQDPAVRKYIQYTLDRW